MAHNLILQSLLATKRYPTVKNEGQIRYKYPDTKSLSDFQIQIINY
jgi:hypothetical protein